MQKRACLAYIGPMPDSPTVRSKPRRQYAALPFRIAKGGTVEIMLITSRDTRRWVIPKGWPIRGLTDPATAAREALEEAGLVGQIGKRRLGSFLYEKRLDEERSVLCAVEVFPFKVKGQRKRWPEKKQRDGRWFPAGEAASAVAEPELGTLIERFGARPGKGSPAKSVPSTPDTSSAKLPKKDAAKPKRKPNGAKRLESA